MDPVASISTLPSEILCGILDVSRNDAMARRVCRLWYDIIEDKYERLYGRILDCCDEERRSLRQSLANEPVMRCLTGGQYRSFFAGIAGLRKKWPLKGMNPHSSDEWAYHAMSCLRGRSGDVHELAEAIRKHDRIHKTEVLDDTAGELRMGPEKNIRIVNALCSIRKLSLRLTGISRLSPAIRFFSALEELDLFSNNLETLPKEIGYLVGLKVLNISFNVLTSLPDEMALLTSLVELDLRGNDKLNQGLKKRDQLFITSNPASPAIQ